MVSLTQCKMRIKMFLKIIFFKTELYRNARHLNTFDPLCKSGHFLKFRMFFQIFGNIFYIDSTKTEVADWQISKMQHLETKRKNTLCWSLSTLHVIDSCKPGKNSKFADFYQTFFSEMFLWSQVLTTQFLKMYYVKTATGKNMRCAPFQHLTHYNEFVSKTQ